MLVKSDNIKSSFSREQLKKRFILDYFKDHSFNINSLQADASFRQYERITHKGKTFILMDSPREHYDLKPFIRVAEFLLKHNFSAPKIHNTDYDNGFLLLEDFGDISVAKHLLSRSKEQTLETYKLILDLLTDIQKAPKIHSINHYSKSSLLKELEVYTDWYVPYVIGQNWDNKQKIDFFSIWSELLDLVADFESCNVLRDYHVENLMLLSLRPGIKSIGILDFQDAVIGSPIYDVVSILEDARIEVPRDFALQCLDYYLQQNKHLVKTSAELTYHILGAQRNLRILGVFARKAKRDNAISYLNYVPLILNYLEYDLSHNCMSQLKSFLRENL